MRARRPETGDVHRLAALQFRADGCKTLARMVGIELVKSGKLQQARADRSCNAESGGAEARMGGADALVGYFAGWPGCHAGTIAASIIIGGGQQRPFRAAEYPPASAT